MRRLLVLWDPENPLVATGPVIQALRQRAEVMTITFQETSHRTSPNGGFKLAPILEREKIDAILWVEGGPLPGDLEDIACLKACWLLNTHHEPTLAEDIGSGFDRRLVAALGGTADGNSRWLPLAADVVPALRFPSGVSIIAADPKSPMHSEVEQTLREAVKGLSIPERSLVFCLGQGGQVHSAFFECLNSGAAVVAEPEADLRGLAHAGEHVEVFPSLKELPSFTRDLLKDDSRLARLAERGPAIVSHLHTAELRAAELEDCMWPRARVLGGGMGDTPEVSILVVCHRYLRRFKYCLESLARQDLSSGRVEIVVADPASPDGLADHLVRFATLHPHLRVVHLPVDSRYSRNRGVAIDRAFEASLGEVVIAIDGDIVFPPHLIGTLRNRVLSEPRGVYGVRRVFVSREDTERILSGALDPHGEFGQLAQSPGDGEQYAFEGVLGYCQAVHRRAFAKARYPQEFDRVNQSDIVFVERLAKHADVRPRFLQEELVLHLWHPRNWEGTNEWL